MEALVEEQFEESRKFFALPVEQKMEMLINQRYHRGYTPFDYEILNPDEQKSPDTKEGIYIGREVAADSVEALTPLHGPNQWPNPERSPRFRPVMEAYFRGTLALGRRTLRLLALALDLDPTWFLDRFQKPLLNFRPLHYSAQRSNTTEGLYGCGAHCDYGVLTLLVTDGSPGLQILKGGAWHDVPPLPGSFVVNLGDMLERWTSGRWKSTMHRVVNTSGRERFSSAFFMEPDFETVIDGADLPTCCPPGGPIFPPITSGQYLLDKYAATQQSKAEAPHKGP